MNQGKQKGLIPSLQTLIIIKVFPHQIRSYKQSSFLFQGQESPNKKLAHLDSTTSLRYIDKSTTEGDKKIAYQHNIQHQK